jgi:hypothetical protein
LKSNLTSKQAVSVLPFALTQRARVPEQDGENSAVKTNISSGVRLLTSKVQTWASILQAVRGGAIVIGSRESTQLPPSPSRSDDTWFLLVK